MSERRSQERDRETVSRDKENIGRHRLGAGAACSLSVSLTPGLGTEETIPRLATGWNKGDQRQKLDTARHRGERERVLHNMCSHQLDPDNNWQVFWKLFRVHQRDLSLADTCHVREGRSVVSCPGL